MASLSLRSANYYFKIGAASFVLFVIVCFGWIGTASLSGAIIARGSVVVQSDAKKVQHPYGGIVAEIRVKNGDAVKSGDLLVRLDDTLLRSNLASIEKSLGELRLRRARLLAERDGKPQIESSEVNELHAGPLSEAVQNETRLFELRSHMRNGRKAQIEERIKQFENEAWGYRVQRESIDSQLKFINQELEGTRQLWSQQLVPLSRVSALEREGARLDGLRGQLIAGIAQTEGKIAEARLSILQIDRDLFSEVGGEIRDVDGKIAPLEEQRVAAQDQLARVMITSPASGIVHQLSAKTVGGVISATEAIMQIIPTEEPVVVDAQVNPADIDQIKFKASALVRMTALNQRTTPELNGVVEHMSPDAISDPRTGITFYQVRISLSAAEIARLNGMPIVPGMPSEVFIKTGDRRVYEMLFKPVSDQLMRAYRQD